MLNIQINRETVKDFNGNDEQIVTAVSDIDGEPTKVATTHEVTDTDEVIEISHRSRLTEIGYVL